MKKEKKIVFIKSNRVYTEYYYKEEIIFLTDLKKKKDKLIKSIEVN